MLPILLLAVLVLLAESYYLGRKGIFAILLAFSFALFVTSFHHYEYAGVANIYVGPINLYPLVCWTAGLTALKIFYDRLEGPHKLFITSALYIGILFALEYGAYQWLHIRTTGGYPSLFGLGIIHGPPLIHWFYVLAGPLYILLLEVKSRRVFRGVKMPGIHR